MSRIAQCDSLGFRLLRLDFSPGRFIMEEDVDIAIVSRTLDSGFDAFIT